VAFFNAPPKEMQLRYEGINLAEGNAPVIAEFYKISTAPLQELALITSGNELAGMAYEAECLADRHARPTAPSDASAATWPSTHPVSHGQSCSKSCCASSNREPSDMEVLHPERVLVLGGEASWCANTAMSNGRALWPSPWWQPLPRYWLANRSPAMKSHWMPLQGTRTVLFR
jgi:hypothetical protein